MIAIFIYLQLKSGRRIIDITADHLNSKAISPCSFRYQQFYLFIMMKVTTLASVVVTFFAYQLL